MHKYDPAEARKLLTEAGHNRLEIVVNFPGKAQGDAYITNLELIQAQLKKVGIDMVLKSIDQTDFSNERKNRTYTMNFGSLSPGETGDYDQAIFATYHSKSKANYGDLKDTELDRLLEAQRGEVNEAKRRELLRTAVRRIMDNVWAIDLHYLPKWEAWQPWVKNYKTSRGQNGPHFEYAWLEK
jgi:peptide/nickel transport system substrate-binding protein